MKEKIEKDVNVAESNKRLILTTAILLFAVAIIYSISALVDSVFYDFYEAAIRWVGLGIGVAFARTYMSQKNNKNIKNTKKKVATIEDSLGKTKIKIVWRIIIWIKIKEIWSFQFLYKFFMKSINKKGVNGKKIFLQTIHTFLLNESLKSIRPY